MESINKKFHSSNFEVDFIDAFIKRNKIESYAFVKMSSYHHSYNWAIAKNYHANLEKELIEAGFDAYHIDYDDIFHCVVVACKDEEQFNLLRLMHKGLIKSTVNV